jgi:arsenate reductase
MAEGWTRHLAAGRMEVVSAGVSPLGHITEETFAVMKEKGVSLDGQTSKGLEEIDWQQVDLLVNMTPLPSRSLVPGFRGNRLNWRVPDPFGRSLKDYRRVRDLLERKVTRLLAQLATQPGGTPTIDLD